MIDTDCRIGMGVTQTVPNIQMTRDAPREERGVLTIWNAIFKKTGIMLCPFYP